MSRFSCFAIRRTNDEFQCKASLLGIAAKGRRVVRQAHYPEPVEGFDGLTMFLLLLTALDYTFPDFPDQD